MLKTFRLFICLAWLFADHAAEGRTLLFKLAQPAVAKRGASEALTGIGAVDQLLAAEGVERVEPLFKLKLPERSELNDWYVCKVSDSADFQQLIDRLMETRFVAAAQPNHVFRLHYEPNDSLYPQQYALQKIHAAQAWDLQRGSSSVVVGVIDTGIDYRHPDLQESLWFNSAEKPNGRDDDGNGFVDDLYGWDFTDAPNYPDGGDYLLRDNDPMDEHGHGTAVAGLIAARTDNGIGIAGLAHGCRVMNLRAFTASGYGEEDDVAAAILYATANGAQVINMSFGDVFVSRLMEDIVRYAAAQGVILVASAGNSATNEIHYPSGFAETISVAATDENDQPASFSNHGGTIDLSAPGSSIISTSLRGGYAKWNGTSFSAPFVSAAAALLLSQRPNLSADAVRAVLVNSADDLGTPGWDDRFGAGRLNVYRALTLPDGAIAQILFPVLDAGLAHGPIDIIGSAWTPLFVGYRLEFGYGTSPKSWTILAEGREPVIEGLLGRWEKLPEQEGEISLRLMVKDRRNRETTAQTRLFIDHSAPQSSSVTVLPMLDADRRAVLIQYETDDLCEGSLFYRIRGENEFHELPLTYRTRTLRRLLNQEKVEGEIEFKVAARNGAGLVSIDDNQGLYYRADLSLPPVDAGLLTQKGIVLPFGRLLGKSSDFDADGRPEVILSVGESGAVGPIKLFEWDGTAMQEVFAAALPLIPRDVGDADGDGVPELLAGYGVDSYLFAGSGVGDFPSQLKAIWRGDGVRQYWAGRIADTDRDGRAEIIMRVVQTSGESFDRWEVHERNMRGEFETAAVLANPTKGENFNGVPHCEIADFDGDGRLEILLGDSDGDVYIYENRGDNTFITEWQDRLPLLDAVDYLAVGDFDGDGISDFAAGCHSDPNLNTEHDYDARHWCVRVYLHEGDNRYHAAAEQRIFGFASPRNYLSSLSAGDLDGDGKDELFVTAFPDFYIFRYQDNELQPVYHHLNAQNAAVLSEDLDGDGRKELLLGDGSELQAMIMADEGAAPAVPAGLSARPLDEHRVRLSWRAVEGADSYRLYKGRRQDNLTLAAETVQTIYFDEDVKEDSLYYYAVQAVDLQKQPPHSRLSNTVTAQPGVRPQLISAVYEAAAAVRLTFSKAMGVSAKDAVNYRLNRGSRPSSAAEAAGGKEWVLSFSVPLAEGQSLIECIGLADRNGVPMDSMKSSAEFWVPAPTIYPFLQQADFSNDGIRLIFNTEMMIESLNDTAHYRINGKRPAEVQALSKRECIVTPLQQPAAGDTLRMTVRNLRAENGRTIHLGRGDSIVLIVPKQDQTSRGISVFPNPCPATAETAFVTFVGLSAG
ncbi:MAG: S8 family serine peptidase, partial [candidate division KSB1 bacterium]|nr:S8 family serine peptidase [candidate division KSB1 bacterium]